MTEQSLTGRAAPETLLLLRFPSPGAKRQVGPLQDLPDTSPPAVKAASAAQAYGSTPTQRLDVPSQRGRQSALCSRQAPGPPLRATARRAAREQVPAVPGAACHAGGAAAAAVGDCSLDAFSQGKRIQNKPRPVTREASGQRCPFHGAALAVAATRSPSSCARFSPSTFFSFEVKARQLFFRTTLQFQGI